MEGKEQILVKISSGIVSRSRCVSPSAVSPSSPGSSHPAPCRPPPSSPPWKDNGPGPGRNYGETGVFTFGRKVVFGLKMGLTPKNHPKWHFPPWLFGQRHFFLWTTFSGRGQNMVNLRKWIKKTNRSSNCNTCCQPVICLGADFFRPF